MSFVRAPAAWSSFTLLHIYLWWYQEHFLYTFIQCDVIDTLLEMDLANGCGGRDLVYLLAWHSLMLLVHMKLFASRTRWECWELRSDIQVAYAVKQQVECRIRPDRAESDDINTKS